MIRAVEEAKHVDTGHNFPEVIEFRDRRVSEDLAAQVIALLDERSPRPSSR